MIFNGQGNLNETNFTFKLMYRNTEEFAWICWLE